MTPLVSTTPHVASPVDRLFSRSARESSRDDFASVLGQAQAKEGETAEETARRSAKSLVAISFIQPILKKLRETNQAAAPFAPTDGEKQFQTVADGALAERIAGAANFKLVDVIAQKLMDRSRSGAGRTDAPGPSPSSGTEEALGWRS